MMPALVQSPGPAHAQAQESARIDALVARQSVEIAQERIRDSEHALRALDEERAGLDATVSTGIVEHSSAHVAVRTGLPLHPQLSSGVRVTATIEGRWAASYSAFELAGLGEPDAIRAVWDKLTQAARQQLLADAPELLGNLDGIPLQDRDQANRVTARAYRVEAEAQLLVLTGLAATPAFAGAFGADIERLRSEIRSIDAILGDNNGRNGGARSAGGQAFGEYLVYDERGRPVVRLGTTLVGFSPLRDSIVTYQGPLDPATGDIPRGVKHVGMMIPGTNSGLASFSADLDRSKELMGESGSGTSYFTWLGAAMPQFGASGQLTDPALRGFAETGSARLAAFGDGIRLPAGAKLVPIGYSYGAAVLGGAEALGLRADRVLYVAPAGLGHEVAGLADFPRSKDAPHYVLQARNDGIVGWNQGSKIAQALRLGHGATNPLNAPGVVRLETGFLDAQHPEKGVIEDAGAAGSHSAVFTPGSTSMGNIAGVVTNGPVSRFIADEPERMRASRTSPRSARATRGGSGELAGAAHPAVREPLGVG